VITVPQRALITRNGDKFVRVIKNGALMEVRVETGLRGSDGNVEIATGISDGESVVTSVQE
jgi:hypothetical protein